MDDNGEFAKTNYNNAITRDNLLSLLYPRITMAKELLTDDGALFCSIDDKNQAYVKGLLDEIFGEKNFVATLHWKKKKQPSFLSKVAGVMEYIHVYAKDINVIDSLSLESPSDSNTRIDNASNNKAERTIPKGTRVKLPKHITRIEKGEYFNRTMSTEYKEDVFIEDGRTTNNVKVVAQFRDSQERIDSFAKEDLLFITRNKGLRRDKSEKEKAKRKAITDLLLDWGTNQDSDNELKSIFGRKNFDYPKPVTLIKNIIKSFNSKDGVVLDFFAGTGTTGHAAALLNLEDGGSRKFILCTNNEADELNPNGIAYDTTAERLKRVMTGEGYDGSSDFEWAKDNEPLGGSLDVYEIKSAANFEQTEGKTPFDVIDETAYDREPFGTINEKIKWVCENFDRTQKYLKGE